ncbi:Primase C terminal 2 (PriCT-2) [Rhodospirillales bacterium URHD0017]|nr:Primase C terminal 2 (PriCT-2) [Rhodospirillales bacterium URHD0017]
MTSPLETALALVPIWLRWKLEPNEKGNLTKAPYSAKHPGKGSHTTPADWGTLAQAQLALERWGGDGLGVVAAAVDHEYVQGELDVDGCYSLDCDQRASWLDPVAEILDGHYCEPSVSGTGLHYHFLVRRDVATRRRWRINAKRETANGGKAHGFELAVLESGGYYLTVTLEGEGELRVLEESQLEALHGAIAAFRPGASKSIGARRAPARPADPDLHTRTLSALAALRNDERFTDRDDWIAIGFAVHDGTGGSLAGRLAWTAWTAEKHADAENSCCRAWDTFTPGGSITVATLFKFAREDGWHDQALRRDPPTGNGGVLASLRDDEPIGGNGEGLPLAVTRDDFLGYSLQGNFIFRPTGQLWPASSINARLRPVSVGKDADGKEIFISASRWISEHQAVEQMTWQPGAPEIIRNRLVVEGAWQEYVGASVFNQYRAPPPINGDPDKAGPYLELARTIYPADADHILDWFAHRVQRPGEKINHMLVLGGDPGIGKDTIIEPVLRAVGERNAHTISPAQFVGRFNGHLKSVVLRVAEAQSGQKFDRFEFYETLKLHGAAPPNSIRIDEKNVQEYSIANVVGLILTANKRSAFYLPADDRRTYVAWSECRQADFVGDHFAKQWRWYEHGGFGHVAAYLARRDLRRFNAKAPPPKTGAFLDIVNLNRASEDAEFADAVDQLNSPKVVTLEDIRDAANSTQAFKDYLNDRRNRRLISHRFEAIDYEPVRNPDAADGLWKVRYRRVVIYARKGLTMQDKLEAARQRASRTGHSGQ